MSNVSTMYAIETSDVVVHPSDVEVPSCERGIGAVITSPTSDKLIDGVRVEPIAIWPDDRGHFMEILRVGHGLASGFQPATSQVSGTLTQHGVVKAFHYHLRQFDCWTVVNGMLQVALADMRRGSRTFGQRNTLYVGSMRPWQVLIPPGVAHGYKVIGDGPAMLVYVTSRFYDPADELRVPYNDSHLAYDWETQFK